MRVLSIAIVLLATPVAAQQPGYAPPEWLRKPSGDDLNAVWPRNAMRKGIDGRATVSCVVTAQGLLENCKVREETPPGEGFGAAALLLMPSFVLKPAALDGKPVSGTVSVPINFKAEGPTSGVDLRAVPMVTDPIWEKAPSFAEMTAAWPKGAKAEFGHVSMRCGVTAEGLLRRCEVITETPRGQGFGKAARETVATLFKLRSSPEAASELAKASVNLPVRFINPSINPGAPRTIAEPKWITRVDPEKVVKLFPEAAAQAGVKTGRGVANCMVAPDGRLTDCKPAEAAPEGMGFSEAAVQVASVMVMNPWSGGGGPVDGVRIRLPVRFNLAPEQEPAPAKP